MASVEQARRVSALPQRARTLEELYALHAPALRRRCERLTRDPHAAEDLMQEVFVRFLARFPEAPPDMHVAGYLHATARNVLWKQLRDEHEVADSDIERSAGSDDDLEIDPERALLLDEQQSLVRRCSALLTGRQRRALTLREVEGRSYAEIGSDLGIGTDAVAQVISRARVRLRVAVRRAHVDLDQLAPECRALLGPLSDYLDGHAAKGTPEIEAHLAECESCRESLAAFQGAGSRLRGTLPLAPLAGILARIGEAVRFGGGGPADAVRAGAVAVAAAIAIGGGGTYVAHELTSSAGPRAAIDHPAHAPRATPPSQPLASSAPRPGAAPLAVRGRREPRGSQPMASGRHPRAKRTGSARPASGPSVSAATAATPGSSPVGTPAAPPSSTPAATPATADPPTKTRPGTVTPPAVDPARLTPPLTGTAGNAADPIGKQVVQPAVAKVVDPVVAKVVSPVVQPVVDKVVDPVVAKVVAPVTKVVAPVTDPVVKAVAPVTKVVAPVTDPVVKAVAPVTTAVAPVTDPVAKAVAPVTKPVADAVAPVTAPVVKAVAPVLPTTTAPATPTPAPQAPAVPATSAPAVATPAVTTPIATVPSIKVTGLGWTSS